MTTLQDYVRRGPHLDMIGSVAVEGLGPLVVHRDHVFVAARHGNAHCVSVIDISTPTNPRLVHTLRFKRSITSLVTHGDLLFAAETGRALNVIRIDQPSRPDYFDCGVALGSSIYEVVLLDHHAVLAMNWDGVGLMDIRDPHRVRMVDRVKLDEGYVEHVAVAGNRIFAAGASGGLRVFDVRDGKLVESGRPCGDNFNAKRVWNIAGDIWVSGSIEDGDSELVVLDGNASVKMRLALDCNTPTSLFALGNGAALGFFSYTCAGYSPSTGWSGELFKQYTADDTGAYMETPCNSDEWTAEQRSAYDVRRTCMDNVDHAVRHGRLLLAGQDGALKVYAIRDSSIFDA